MKIGSDHSRAMKSIESQPELRKGSNTLSGLLSGSRQNEVGGPLEARRRSKSSGDLPVKVLLSIVLTCRFIAYFLLQGSDGRYETRAHEKEADERSCSERGKESPVGAKSGGRTVQDLITKRVGL